VKQSMNCFALFPQAILVFVDFESRRILASPMFHGKKSVSLLLGAKVCRHFGLGDEWPADDEAGNKRDASQHQQAGGDGLPPTPGTDVGLHHMDFGDRYEDSREHLLFPCRPMI